MAVEYNDSYYFLNYFFKVGDMYIRDVKDNLVTSDTANEIVLSADLSKAKIYHNVHVNETDDEEASIAKIDEALEFMADLALKIKDKTGIKGITVSHQM